jgi:hypothetical protein
MSMEFENVNPTSQNVVPSNVNHVNLIIFENKENRINPYRTVTKFLKKVFNIATF